MEEKGGVEGGERGCFGVKPGHSIGNPHLRPVSVVRCVTPVVSLRGGSDPYTLALHRRNHNQRRYQDGI